MDKPQKRKWVLVTCVIVALILAIIGLSLWSKAKHSRSVTVKIGIVTDLTGPAAYWGESSRAGAELALKELEDEGYKAELIFEDYQLDPVKAMAGAKKLVESDGVNALYAEFNPAVYSINPYIKDKNMLFVYDAAPVSPLADNSYAYKIYLDYQAGNRLIAEKFKSQGISKIGILKMNYEPGELGLAGIKEVFGNNVTVESYDLGATDLKTEVLKLKNSGAEAVINVAAFESDTLNSLKALKELDFKVPYGTVDDSITENVTGQYSNELEGAITFGFPKVDESFSKKLELSAGKKLATEYGAAITYTHIKQLVRAIISSKGDLAEAKEIMSKSKADDTIGFRGFNDRIAELEMQIKQY